VHGRILIALALVGGLAGCQESGFDESRETQRPLKVQHALDPLTGTRVPGRAERPLTLTADALGDTLALGLEPVAAAEPPPYMRSAARGVERVSDSDLSAIEGADPDVILGSEELQGDEYEELRKIAPTIMSEGSDWKLNLRLHGEALGRTNDAERLLIDWDNRVAKVKEALRDRRFTVRLRGGETPGPIGESVLADLEAGSGRGSLEVVRMRGGPEWSTGGVLAARSVLEQLAALA
jgi:iron complex transport system substrate-binding protein